MTAVSLENYDRLVGRIYEGTLDRGRWQGFVDALADFAGGVRVTLHAHDFGERCNLGVITTYDPGFIGSYQEHYASVNAWAPVLATMPVGTAQQPETFLERDRLIATEFYNDWLRPQGIVTAAGIVLHRDENRFLALSVDIETKAEDRLKASMLKLLDRLAPHLRRSFGLIRQLSGRSIDAMLEDSLESMPKAAFLVDRRGRLTHANALGEALLAGGQTLKVGNDRRLSFRDPRAQEQVDQVLDSLDSNHRPGMGASFAVRGDGGATMLGNIIRFRPASAFDEPPFSILTDSLPAAILALDKPAQPGAMEVLAGRFGLSPAERRVVEALCSGSTLQDFADLRGISIHTARNQLKSLMAKSGVARQSQLVALFAVPPAGTQ